MSAYWRDWLERVAWTLAQAALGVLVVQVTDLDVWWAVALVPLLAAVKGTVARKVGDTSSASLGGDTRG